MKKEKTIKTKVPRNRLHHMQQGRLVIKRSFLLESNVRYLRKIFSDVFVVLADNNFATDEIRYIAYSKHFDIIPEGGSIPSYRYINGKWTRVPDEGLTR